MSKGHAQWRRAPYSCTPAPPALKAFARFSAHEPTARGFSPQMRDAKFVTWTVTTDDLPLDWSDALRRL
ncbi:hypothetical protein G6048_02335 [Streptomyces sp. YC419]|uniref:DUF3291 domain-containing protein n=1 Tax=Streptomyces ureilyticus TaxID=1775131 RepID=A0ABX0DK11_9ACTN|nr:hypothetical protein [Streptomyces ureilyticus]